jgi:hypothetical protein
MPKVAGLRLPEGAEKSRIGVSQFVGDSIPEVFHEIRHCIKAAFVQGTGNRSPSQQKVLYGEVAGAGTRKIFCFRD